MKDTSITFKLSVADKERIVAAAAERDVPVSQLLREIIKDYLSK